MKNTYIQNKTHCIVVARADGRGGIKPFGTFGKKQKGFTVSIGNRRYKVTSDGRVNIPKKIMNEMGINNADGRKVIQMRFSSKAGKEGSKSRSEVGAVIGTPNHVMITQNTGDTPKEVLEDKFDPEDKNDFLEPFDEQDFSWS